MDALEMFSLLVAGGVTLTVTLGALLLVDRSARHKHSASNAMASRSVRPFGPCDDRRAP